MHRATTTGVPGGGGRLRRTTVSSATYDAKIAMVIDVTTSKGS